MISKNRKEVYLEEILDNLTGNMRELPVDCHPKTREEVLLSEIEKNTRGLNSSGSGGYKIWVGTENEYDSILTKDDNTLYFIRGE